MLRLSWGSEQGLWSSSFGPSQPGLSALLAAALRGPEEEIVPDGSRYFSFLRLALDGVHILPISSAHVSIWGVSTLLSNGSDASMRLCGSHGSDLQR